MRAAVLPDEATWPAFRESVHAALVHLHDPPALETHALAAAARATRPIGAGTRGRALRDALVRAIEGIAPAGGRASASSRPYLLMKKRYLDGDPIAAIRGALAVGRSEYFREHARGLDAVAAILWEEWRAPGPAPAGAAGAAHGRPPRPATSFVGRAGEIDAVLGLFREGRLVTLAGPGGVGKTRLALRLLDEAAAERERWFVDLSGADAAANVGRLVVAALGLRERSDEPPAQVLLGYLQGRAGLLVLDNCEHLVGQCAVLAQALIEACPDLRVLTTSREPLRVAGEAVYAVRPLTHPASDAADERELLRYEAVQLFAERARAVLPGFRVVEQNARSVARLCRRLDGMPLALELAAARLRGLSVGQIEARLDDSLRLLDAGQRTAQPRHRTLRALVEWSLELLGDAERALFRRLSVFAGGWTLEAAEAVCGPDEDLLGGLLGLVEKSLVVAEVGELGRERYRLLEVLRQAGRELLARSGEAPELERRHCEYFVGLAEEAEVGALDAAQERWYERVDRELENLRAAAGWAAEHEVALGLRLAGALWRYWYVRGHVTEGRELLAGLMRRGEPTRDATRGKALFAAAQLAVIQGDAAAGRPLAEESLAIRQALDDRVGAGWSTHALAHCVGDHAAERELLASAAALLRGTGDDLGLAWTLFCQANALDLAGRADESARLHAEALRLFEGTGNRWGIALGLIGMGNAALRRDDHARAYNLYEQGLALQRAYGHRYLSDTLNALGRAALGAGRHDEAAAHFRESLELARQHGARWEIGFSLEGLASVALAAGRPAEAARLLGAAAGVREALASTLSPAEQAAFDGRLAAAGAALGEAALREELARGRAMLDRA